MGESPFYVCLHLFVYDHPFFSCRAIPSTVFTSTASHAVPAGFMSSDTVKTLIEKVQARPAGANPYSVAAALLTESLALPQTASWLDKVFIVFVALYALQALICFSAIIVVSIDGKFWLWRRGRDDIILLNARIVYSSFAGLFSLAMVVDCSWQIMIDHGKASSKNKVALEGTRWIFLWLTAWFFGLGIVSQILVSKEHGELNPAAPPLSDSDGGGEDRNLILVYNIALVTVPFLVATLNITAFVVGTAALNECLAIVGSVAVVLLERAPTYNAATFQISSDLTPLLDPLKGSQAPMARFVSAFRVGWIGWAVFDVLLAVFVLPFVVRHLDVLRQLIGAPSIASALFSCHLFAHNSPKEGPSLASPQDSVRLGNTAQDHLRAEYKSLAFRAICIVICLATYTPLAMWAAIPGTLELVRSDRFWAMQAVWGSGAYAICGSIVNSLFLWRVMLSHRSDSSSRESPSCHDHGGGSPQSPPIGDGVRVERTTTLQLRQFFHEPNKETQLESCPSDLSGGFSS